MDNREDARRAHAPSQRRRQGRARLDGGLPRPRRWQKLPSRRGNRTRQIRQWTIGAGM